MNLWHLMSDAPALSPSRQRGRKCEYSNRDLSNSYWYANTVDRPGATLPPRFAHPEDAEAQNGVDLGTGIGEGEENRAWELKDCAGTNACCRADEHAVRIL